MTHAVETDLKRLLRNPPLVKIPKIGDMISAHPLLGALPSPSRALLIASTKEIMKPRGTTLYKQGSKPNGIWLISSGVVKWASKIIESKHALHPTFTHGTTLGLYELLIGKPYIMDMTADSVLFCFYIETDKILSVLRSDPSLEDFFWKVCKHLGLSDIDLFTPSDVVDKGNTRKVCMCLRSLSKKAKSRNLNVPDFDSVTVTHRKKSPVNMPTDNSAYKSSKELGTRKQLSYQS